MLCILKATKYSLLIFTQFYCRLMFYFAKSVCTISERNVIFESITLFHNNVFSELYFFLTCRIAIAELLNTCHIFVEMTIHYIIVEYNNSVAKEMYFAIKKEVEEEMFIVFCTTCRSSKLYV